MSDHFIRVIPMDPTFVPTEHGELAALAFARERGFAGASSQTYEHVSFIDGGENFPRSMPCSSCGFNLADENRAWTDAMSVAYARIPAFSDLNFLCPSCASPLSLLDISLEGSTHGFARWVLEWPHPGTQLQAEDLASFSKAVGCEVRVIYQHR